MIDAYGQLAGQGFLQLRRGAVPTVATGGRSEPGPVRVATRPEPGPRFDLRATVYELMLFRRREWRRAVAHALSAPDMALPGRGPTTSGLETEAQWVDGATHDVVEPGMVINIELYSLTASGEQIGDERTYVIGADGPRRISRLSTDLRSA